MLNERTFAEKLLINFCQIRFELSTEAAFGCVACCVWLLLNVLGTSVNKCSFPAESTQRVPDED